MANLNIDTDLLCDVKALREELIERCILTDGCLLFPHYVIRVRLRGHSGTTCVSVARVAWALANPHDHLGVRDCAVHTCRFGTQGTLEEPRTCCSAEHIIKGDRIAAQHMAHTRRKVWA